MPFSLLALIIFSLFMLLLHTVFILQEKCNTMSGKNICRALPTSTVFTLILATAVNGFIEYYTKSSWGTPLAESFTIICIGLIVFFTICVFKDAYFSYSETPVKISFKAFSFFINWWNKSLYWYHESARNYLTT